MIWDEWLIDVTSDVHNEEIFTTRVFCFSPYERDTGKVVSGMGLITDWPDDGKVVGIYHMGGQEAVDKWMDNNPDIVAIIEERQAKATADELTDE